MNKPQFRKSVYRHRTIPAGCKLLLLLLSDRAPANGIVSVPRSELAKELQVAPSRITEWVTTAKRAGFIQTVKRGQPGVTAVYHLLTVLGTESVPQLGTESGPPLGTENLSKQGVRNPDQQNGQLGTDSGQPREKTLRNVQSARGPDPDEAATGESAERSRVWVPGRGWEQAG